MKPETTLTTKGNKAGSPIAFSWAVHRLVLLSECTVALVSTAGVAEFADGRTVTIYGDPSPQLVEIRISAASIYSK